VSLFVADKLGSLTVYHMIHIQNQRDPDSSWVCKSLALVVSIPVRSKVRIDNRKSHFNQWNVWMFRRKIIFSKKFS